MSKKVRQRRAAAPHSNCSLRRVSLAETPPVEGLVPLICGVCGVAGRYNVGTVVFDPEIARSVDESALEEAVGFTGYFRCRKCNAGGPWKMPDQTLAHVISLVTAAIDGAEDVPLFLGATTTFDGKIIRYATDGEAHLKKLIDGEPERVYL